VARRGGRWAERPAARSPPAGVAVEAADFRVRVCRGRRSSMSAGFRGGAGGGGGPVAREGRRPAGVGQPVGGGRRRGRRDGATAVQWRARLGRAAAGAKKEG